MELYHVLSGEQMSQFDMQITQNGNQNMLLHWIISRDQKLRQNWIL